jgi:Berberine and berberine like.
VAIDFAARRLSPHTRVSFQQMHGAAARVTPTETAFAHRHDQWDFLALSQWERPEDDEPNVRWARELFAAMQPYLEPAVYVNSLGGPDDGDRVRQAFGENYDRLAAIKKAYDPNNFFRSNQNVT